MSGLKGLVGASGTFHIYRMSPQDIQGSGENGTVEFHDLWECDTDDNGQMIPRRDNNGEFIPKTQIVEERQFKNKWTRRGLSYLLYLSLKGHTAVTYDANVPEIISAGTTNPLLAFCLFADDVANSKLGDARVEFSESDTANDFLLSPSTAVIGQGRRGILLSATTGTFKRVSILHVGTSPYGVLEYTFYAQPNSPAIQTGVLGLDDFPIHAVALTAAVACGDGEASSKIGVRAIVGKAPTLQGKCDRIYVHEGQQQGVDLVKKAYLLDESAVGEVASVDGYLESSSLAAVQIGITSVSGGAGDTITAATKTIVLSGAAAALPATSGFNAAAHTRKVLRIAGSGYAGNNRDFTIREVVSATTVKVFEAPTDNDAGNVNAFTGGVFTVYAGHNAFDGRVLNYGRVETVDTGTYPVPYDTPGTIIPGEFWSSVDTAGAHTIGRIFPSTVTNLSGIRILVPKDQNLDFIPETFTIQYLNPLANGGNPRPGYSPDWVNTSLGVSTVQGGILQASAQTGLGTEYVFTPVDARGIRLTTMTSYSATRMSRVAELFAFTYIQAGNELTLSGNTLSLKTKSANPYTVFSLDDVAPTTSLVGIVDAINKSVRGYEMEAIRSTFGHLWLRSTVAGDYSNLYLDAEGTTGAATELGLPTIATTKTGITQPVTKLLTDAMTIVYRIYLTGNVPGGYPA